MKRTTSIRQFQQDMRLRTAFVRGDRRVCGDWLQSHNKITPGLECCLRC